MKLFKQLKSAKKSLYNFFTGRWYELWVSAHGFGFIRDGGLFTLKQVRKDADYWIGYADTVGGQSQIKNTYTGKIVPTYPNYPYRKKEPITCKIIVWKMKQPFRIILRKLLKVLG